jgi:NAD(P)-dependent dehydrogenase (short-subunit alcohol dehydrogenase family)
VTGPSVGLLEGKVLLVSGGTQGMGAAVARAAVDEGATVAVSGRRQDLGRSFAAELTERGGREALFVAADVADVAQAQGSVAAVVGRWGRIDCLVNAAGLTTRGTLLDTTPELFDDHVAVNLRAPFFTMQEAVRDMVGRGAPGTVVNVITMTSHGGQPHLAAYAAAKAGLAGLTRNVAHAHRWDRVRVNGVNIGWTDTAGEDAVQREFHGAGDDWRERAAAALPMRRLGRPEDAAALVVLLLSERSGVVTGSVIDWDQHVVGGQD